jgi:hypothetical protein
MAGSLGWAWLQAGPMNNVIYKFSIVLFKSNSDCSSF